MKLLNILVFSFVTVACCPQKRIVSNIALQEKIKATSVENYYDLYTKITIPQLVDSINNLVDIELMPKLLENPCFDTDNMDGWKDPQLPLSFREMIIMNITNVSALEHIANNEKYNNICLTNGRHYNQADVPYNHISNCTLAQIRLKLLKYKQ